MNKIYHFFAGLPRSGSTVLASILNQNPHVYVTPTSPMLNVTVKMQAAWREDPTVQANYIEQQINDLTRAILPAFWQHRPEPIIIDKGRSWAKNMTNANALFGTKVKVLVMTRDLPSIMASWLALIRRQSKSNVDDRLIKLGHIITDENRLGLMWSNLVQDCMEGVKQINQEVPDQVLNVTYDDLVENPKQVLLRIQDFLELPKFQYNFTTIENDTVDDDLSAWGFQGLHTIRPKLEKTSINPKQILGSTLYQMFLELEKQYI